MLSHSSPSLQQNEQELTVPCHSAQTTGSSLKIRSEQAPTHAEPLFWDLGLAGSGPTPSCYKLDWWQIGLSQVLNGGEEAGRDLK